MVAICTALFGLLSATANGQSAEGAMTDLGGDDGACGAARSISALEFQHSGHLYSLPASIRIDLDGETIFESNTTTPWQPPYNGAAYSTFDKYLLLEVFEQDCVDLFSSRLFVIDADKVLLEQAIWTSHWQNGFFIESGELVYWSEWFCHPNNAEREGSSSYVYVFSEADVGFYRRDLKDSAYCAKPEAVQFMKFAQARERE